MRQDCDGLDGLTETHHVANYDVPLDQREAGSEVLVAVGRSPETICLQLERANGSAAAPRRSSATTRCRPRKYAALPVNAVGIGLIRVSAANRRRSGRASPTSKHGTSPLTPIPPSKSRYRGAVARPPADGPFSRRQIGPSPLDAEGLAQLFVEDSAGSKATHRAELAG
jgi:hypothetical protein